MKDRGNWKLKFVDRYFGIPLVFFLGLRKKRRLPEKIRKIGLFKEACIGDTILLAGILRDLRQFFPEARIILLVGPTNAGIAKSLPEVDEISILNITNPLACVRELRRHPMDVLLDFGQWPRINAIYSILSGAKFTVGFKTNRQYRHFGYDATAEHCSDKHELENFQSILKSVGMVSFAHLPKIDPPPGGSPENGRYVVFHAWAGGTLSHSREWATDRWVALGDRIRAMGWKIVLTGASSDHSRAIELQHAMGIEGVSNRAGIDGLGDVAKLLRSAGCVVSVNTGIMHLSAAVGASTIGLNGPTAEHRWGPLGSNSQSISVPYPAGGYLNLGFEYDGHPLDAMDHITVDAVWSKVFPILEKYG